ncbi:MAG: acyl-CoA thioesterase [Lysinibacillus sp.]|nr:acyl-CoA thioesterase [Lysinibacillus sp.]
MHKYKYKVRWGDTDAAGIVFTPNFYKWMDEATHEYLAELIKPSSKLFKEDKYALPILEAFCQFKKPLMFEDEVVVETTVLNIQNKTFKLKHSFIRDGEEIATGYMVRAWTSFSDKPKAMPIPMEVVEKLKNSLEKEGVVQ